MTLLNWLQNRSHPLNTIQFLGGLTNCAQVAEMANGERFVLHKQTERATHFGIDYVAEAKILHAIAKLNIAPLVHYANEQGSVLQWLNGTVPTGFSDKLITQLAQLIAKLHHFDFKGKNLRTLDLTARSQFIWHNLPESVRQSNLAPNMPIIQPFTTALCHMDLHLGNLIQTDNHLRLIDWEFSAISDPALDIAMLFHSSALTTTQKTQFLAQYCDLMEFQSDLFNHKIVQYNPVINELNRLWGLVNLHCQ